MKNTDHKTTYSDLKSIVDQLEKCDFECEGGPMNGNVAFIALREMAKKQAKTNPNLRELNLFLEGKITHILDVDYSGFKIKEVGKYVEHWGSICSVDEFTCFLKKNQDGEIVINGIMNKAHDRGTVFCSSLDEAKEKAKKFCLSKSNDRDNFESAQKYGIDLGADYSSAFKLKEEERLVNMVDMYQENLKKAQGKLDKFINNNPKNLKLVN